jgi:hypothetical protein
LNEEERQLGRELCFNCYCYHQGGRHD